MYSKSGECSKEFCVFDKVFPFAQSMSHMTIRSPAALFDLLRLVEKSSHFPTKLHTFQWNLERFFKSSSESD